MIILIGTEGTKFAIWIEDIQTLKQKVAGTVEVHTASLVYRCTGNIEDIVEAMVKAG